MDDYGQVFGLIRDSLSELKKGQHDIDVSIGILHEKVNENNLSIVRVEQQLSTKVSHSDFQSAIAKECTTRKANKPTALTAKGPWWSSFLQGVNPYLLVIVALILILVVVVTGRPANDFMPYSKGTPHAQPSKTNGH